MQSFIVLGIIPGTNLQLTFNFWLGMAGLLIALPLLRALWRGRSQIAIHIAALRIARIIEQYQLPA